MGGFLNIKNRWGRKRTILVNLRLLIDVIHIDKLLKYPRVQPFAKFTSVNCFAKSPPCKNKRMGY